MPPGRTTNLPVHLLQTLRRWKMAFIAHGYFPYIGLSLPPPPGLTAHGITA